MNRREKGALATAFIVALALHGGLAAFQLPAFFPAQSFYVHSSDALQVSFAVGDSSEEGVVADDSVQETPEPEVLKEEAPAELIAPTRPEIVAPVPEPRREPVVQKEPLAAPVPIQPGEPESSTIEKKDLEKQGQHRVPSATPKDDADRVEVGGDSAPPAVGKEPTEKTIVPAIPRYRDNPPPRYPPSALRRGQEGLVLLSVTVGVDGRPREVALKDSSGYHSLDRSAIASVRNWRFDPATSRGVPFEMIVDVPIRFELRQDRW